jgi:dTDP-4-amino-4,6-dideoxygalactose transaminase
MSEPLPFIDLAAQRRRLGKPLDDAILRAVDDGKYIMGPEVATLEKRLAEFCGAGHAITCSNGTDALVLCLRAKGIGPGDAVFVPSFTFAATAEVVAWVGATPVFVDVLADSFNMDPASLEAGITTAWALDLKPAGVIAVDLFGQPADYDAIAAIANRHGLWLVADAAQSFGATYKGRTVGRLAEMTTTSFFPAKPLGCYGDGGAVFTDDAGLAEIVRSLRVHGKGKDKYDNVRVGMNARLDTLQAAILLEKLSIFPGEVEARQRIGARYNALLADVAIVPALIDGAMSVWAQYTIRVPDRDRLASALKEVGIPTAVYYPMPLHKQTAYCAYPVAGNGLPVSENLSAEVISLPMHPYLDEPTQDRIVAAVKAAV